MVDDLKTLKKNGFIKHIGVSIYSPEELELLNNEYANLVDVVQIPYNILDNKRWEKAVVSAKRNKFLLYARSIFLQGLLLKEKNDKIVEKFDIQKIIIFLDDFCRKKNITRIQLLIAFAKSSGLSGILFGCETVNQVKNTIDVYNNAFILGEEDFYSIKEISKDIDERIVDPRYW